MLCRRETIFGYKDLCVRLLFTACDLRMYYEFTFGEKVDERALQVRADDVYAAVVSGWTENQAILRSRDEFAKALDRQSAFRPYGSLAHAYTVDDTNSRRRVRAVWHACVQRTHHVNSKFIRCHWLM